MLLNLHEYLIFLLWVKEYILYIRLFCLKYLYQPSKNDSQFVCTLQLVDRHTALLQQMDTCTLTKRDSTLALVTLRAVKLKRRLSASLTLI